ncbi:hypothetical protein [Streptomyces wuyuanensis]|uniref:hypothetical protein n=1 Tax=Streptomyces wuyuanensis TaxID=1196353 RepID=UPI003798025B
MSAEIITAAVMATPAALMGAVCLAGHRLSRRADDALAAALDAHAASVSPQPPNGGETLTPCAAEPAQLATVIDFPARRRDAA